MAGLVTKSEGTVKIWGRDIDADPRNARAAIGVVPQEVNIDPFFTPRQSLELMAGLYGVPKAERITEKLLDMVGLLDKADAYARSLSGGMKRRLMVAKAFVHQPPILVLDEPTAGVDIELRKMLWKNVKALNKQGVTILLTTHYLEEAEEMCDRIAIINHGKVVANEETETLLSGIDNKEIRFVIDRKIEAIPDTKGRFTLEKEGGRTLVARYAPGEVKAGDIIALIQKSGYGIADLSTNDADLEDVFLKLTSNAG